jgi:hypothetical protein
MFYNEIIQSTPIGTLKTTSPMKSWKALHGRLWSSIAVWFIAGFPVGAGSKIGLMDCLTRIASW